MHSDWQQVESALTKRLSLKEKAFGWLCFSRCTKSCVPPHPSRYSIDTFPHLGEGFYSHMLWKKLECLAQQSPVATPDFRTQLSPRGTLIADQRRAGEARPRGKSEGLTGRSLLQTRQHKVFTCHGGPFTGPAFQFKSNFLLRHTQVLCFFLDSRKKRILFVPLVPFAPQLLIRVSSTFRRERMRFSSREM